MVATASQPRKPKAERTEDVFRLAQAEALAGHMSPPRLAAIHRVAKTRARAFFRDPGVMKGLRMLVRQRALEPPPDGGSG